MSLLDYVISTCFSAAAKLLQSCPTSVLVTPQTAAHQAPPSMGFSRQEYWSGLPFPSPGNFPNPGIKSRSPALQADSLPTELQGKPIIIQVAQLHKFKRASQVALVVKNPRASTRDYKRHGFTAWVWKIPWRRAWQPTPVLLP